MTGCEQRLFSVEQPFLQLTLRNFKEHLYGLAERSIVQSRSTDMPRSVDHTGAAAPLLLPASDEGRAPTAILSAAKRAALIACLNGGSLHKRCGVWTAPCASTGEKPVSGATVAVLGRDGMLTLIVLGGSASARLTVRGNWFARTVATELAERAAL
jgi:hypothetical protein